MTRPDTPLDHITPPPQACKPVSLQTSENIGSMHVSEPFLVVIVWMVLLTQILRFLSVRELKTSLYQDCGCISAVGDGHDLLHSISCVIHPSTPPFIHPCKTLVDMWGVLHPFGTRVLLWQNLRDETT